MADLHVRDYSPWEGWQVEGWPTTVILRGKSWWRMANCWARPAMASSLPAKSIRGCCGARLLTTFSTRRETMYAVPGVDEVVAVAKELAST